jgi:hypothetical protein
MSSPSDARSLSCRECKYILSSLYDASLAGWAEFCEEVGIGGSRDGKPDEETLSVVIYLY